MQVIKSFFKFIYYYYLLFLFHFPLSFAFIAKRTNVHSDILNFLLTFISVLAEYSKNPKVRVFFSNDRTHDSIDSA